MDFLIAIWVVESERALHHTLALPDWVEIDRDLVVAATVSTWPNVHTFSYDFAKVG